MSDGIAAATERCWQLFDESRDEGRALLGGSRVLSQETLDVTRQKVRDHKLFMATADRTSPAELAILLQQVGFLSAAVPYLLDEIDRLRLLRQ